MHTTPTGCGCHLLTILRTFQVIQMREVRIYVWAEPLNRMKRLNGSQKYVWAEPLSRMKRLNGFSEVLRGFERSLITSEKFSVYFSEVHNPPSRPMLGWGCGGVGVWGCGGVVP